MRIDAQSFATILTNILYVLLIASTNHQLINVQTYVRLAANFRLIVDICTTPGLLQKASDFLIAI